MITLVMLSGGLDSAYVLYRLLHETDDEVLVHHVHLLTDLGRHIPEAKSCQRIVEYCRSNVRAFTYSESTIDRRGFCCHGYDLLSAGIEAGVVAASFSMRTRRYVDRWTVGIAKDDRNSEERIEAARRCCEFNCQCSPTPDLFLFPPIGPREEAAYMPLELFDLTWSCRQPQGLPQESRPCGKCQSCRRRGRADPRYVVVAERDVCEGLIGISA